MFGEHILYSIAFAIIIGSIYEYVFNVTLPVWIIAACAWLPDVDYILQTITSNFYYVTHFILYHGDFHTIFGLIGLSCIISYMLNKYKNIKFMTSFFCVSIGFIIHMFCDYFVYDMVFHPLYPLDCVIWGCPLIDEFGSFYGIGEFSIITIGLIFIVFALTIKIVLDNIPKLFLNKFYEIAPS